MVNIKTYNHAGGFTYVTADDIVATYGQNVMLEFARWLNGAQCPMIKGVTAAYYVDFVAFMENRKPQTLDKPQ